MNNQQKTKKRRLLNLGREREFLFDLDEVLDASNADENRGILRANILKKASQNGIDEAIAYLDEVGEDIIVKDASSKIKRLLTRYSIMRA